ncbi:MAG: o-succinylbenzoate--CoA ligase [Mycobacteriaceae bacterium]
MSDERRLELLRVPHGSAVLDLLPALDTALAGRGPAWLPVPADDAAETRRRADALGVGQPVDETTALVVATSGSTGTSKGALLGAAALRASASATHARLGGPGTWLLALPAHHVAGLAVLTRSVLAGTTPSVLDPGADADALAAALTALTGTRRYTSLVPTQLTRALAHPGATAALAELDAVLIGGAATPPPLLAQSMDAGIPVVRTYGMSETCGGCVYDGVALDGVRVQVQDGRVLLGGATLASGYRGQPDHPAFSPPGWFRTDDAGELNGEVLRVTGRLDDAITTGGLTVMPAVVEAALGTHPGVQEVTVLGVPDDTWGERVVAFVVPTGDEPTLEQLREHVSASLDRSAAPREVHLLDALPLRGPGKVDRRALRAMITPPG